MDIVVLVEDVRTEIKNKGINIEELVILMDEAGKEYLKQFSGEMCGANALGLGAFLSGDMELDRFADLSVKMIEVANKKGIRARNYFEILLDEVKDYK